MLLITTSVLANTKLVISVFYKDMNPSQKVLDKVNNLLMDYQDLYQINYYLIDDPANSEIIAQLGLPSTHFPFAVVIDGKFSAKINDQVVSFVHFPHFMKGIGRHEGNWSINVLEQVLKDNSLLLEENVLPTLAESENETDCED